MSKKYLYSTSNCGLNRGSIYRYEVSRETKSNFWIISHGNTETKISKSKMRTGSTWHMTYYKEETDDLIIKYKNYIYDVKFKKALDSLSKKEVPLGFKKEIIGINESIESENEPNN